MKRLTIPFFVFISVLLFSLYMCSDPFVEEEISATQYEEISVLSRSSQDSIEVMGHYINSSFTEAFNQAEADSVFDELVNFFGDDTLGLAMLSYEVDDTASDPEIIAYWVFYARDAASTHDVTYAVQLDKDSVLIDGVDAIEYKVDATVQAAMKVHKCKGAPCNSCKIVRQGKPLKTVFSRCDCQEAGDDKTCNHEVTSADPLSTLLNIIGIIK